MCKFNWLFIFLIFLTYCSDKKKSIQGEYDFHSAVCEGDYPVFLPAGISDFRVNLKAFEEDEASSSGERESSIQILSSDKTCLLNYSFSLESTNRSTDNHLECSSSCKIPLVINLLNYPLSSHCGGESKCPINLGCDTKEALQVHSVDYSNEENPLIKLLVDVNHSFPQSSFYISCHVKLKKQDVGYDD